MARRPHFRTTGAIWPFVLLILVVIGISLIIYGPVIKDCNERHGEVVRNWANFPICIDTH